MAHLARTLWWLAPSCLPGGACALMLRRRGQAGLSNSAMQTFFACVPAAAAPSPSEHAIGRRASLCLQEFRRLQSMVGAARDRFDLLGGAGGSGQHAPLLQGQSSNAGLLLRERGMLASTNAALDEVMGTAQVGRLPHAPVLPCCHCGAWLGVRRRDHACQQRRSTA